jgi:hypothetical protein
VFCVTQNFPIMEEYMKSEELKEKKEAAYEAVRDLEATMLDSLVTQTMKGKTTDSVPMVVVEKSSPKYTKLPESSTPMVTVTPYVEEKFTVSYIEQEVRKLRQNEADLEEDKLLANLSSVILKNPDSGSSVYPIPEWPVPTLYPATTTNELPPGWSVTNTETEGFKISLRMSTMEGLLGFFIIMGMGKSFFVTA